MEKYLLFKDFAGPIATIIAATVAAGTASLFAYRQARSAEQQAKTAKNKLKADTFQMKFGVYQAAYRVAQIAMFHHAPDKNIGQEFFECTIKSRESVFLFPKEKSDFLLELVDNCHRLVAGRNMLNQMNGMNRHFDKQLAKVDKLELDVNKAYSLLPIVFVNELSLSFSEEKFESRDEASVIYMLIAIIGALILLVIYLLDLW